jgi:hypothetical protein
MTSSGRVADARAVLPGTREVWTTQGWATAAPTSLSAAELAEVRWAYRTGRFAVPGHAFAVRSTSPGVGRYLDHAWSACARPGDAGMWYSIVEGIGGPWPYTLYAGSELAVQTASPARVLAHLSWRVNQRVIHGPGDHVVVHAAAAARDGVGVLLPAGTEAGKSTLVAGLVRAGFDYLSDEAVGVEPDTLDLVPYPKPLSLDTGSWSVLPKLRPDVDEATRPYLAEQWQVPPRAIRRGVRIGSVAAGVVILPRYEAGAVTRLDPVGRAEALLDVLQQTFRLAQRGSYSLEVLARLLRRARCYRLTVGDLDVACSEVTRAVSQVEGSGGDVEDRAGGAP